VQQNVKTPNLQVHGTLKAQLARSSAVAVIVARSYCMHLQYDRLKTHHCFNAIHRDRNISTCE